MALADLRIISSPRAPRPAPQRYRVALEAPDGRHVSDAEATISFGTHGWEADVHDIARPGALASYYFGNVQRRVVFRLPDRRSASGLIVSTRFAKDQRVYRIEGEEPFRLQAIA
jgi:hypothetical protein